MGNGMSHPGMNDERDEESGKFQAKHSAEQFLSALHDLDGGGTSDVADSVGCPDRTAYHWLDKLRDQGKVVSREVGGSLFWETRDG